MEDRLGKNRMMPDMKDAWRTAWKSRNYRYQFLITMGTVLSFSFIFKYFFDFVEMRHGIVLHDIILNTIPAFNVSWGVFFFLYSGIFTGLISHRAHPKTILMIFQTYVIVTFIRIATITLFPLEPPVGYIPLREPFVQLFTNGGRIISRDLFFSGHMSTILSLYFATHLKPARTYLLFAAAMIGALLLVQHVHYTIDVIVAVPATFLIFSFCKKYLAGSIVLT